MSADPDHAAPSTGRPRGLTITAIILGVLFVGLLAVVVVIVLTGEDDQVEVDPAVSATEPAEPEEPEDADADPPSEDEDTASPDPDDEADDEDQDTDVAREPTVFTADRAAPEHCGLLMGNDDHPTWGDDDRYYEEIVAVNFQLETVLDDFTTDWSDWKDGALDDAGLDERMTARTRDFRGGVTEIAGPGPVTPRWSYRGWHAGVLESWSHLCVAIHRADLAADGDGEAEAGVDEALTDTPTLGQRLHATTALSPQEWLEEQG